MTQCDPNVAEIILNFAVGGITLRAIVSLLNEWLKTKGILALLLTFTCCGGAVIVYMAFTGFAWMCFLFYTCLVFAGTQVAYRMTHK